MEWFKNHKTENKNIIKLVKNENELNKTINKLNF